MRSGYQVKDRELFDQLCDGARKYHSEFQIRHFMLRRGNFTSWGEYVQVLRELSARRDAHDLGEIEIRILDSDIQASTGGNFEKERKKIQLRELKRSQAQRLEEIDTLMQVAVPLHEKFGALTRAEREKLEAQDWLARIATKAQFEILGLGRITPDTIDTVMALTQRDREWVLDRVRTTQEKPSQALEEIGRVLDVSHDPSKASAVLR